jgi:hypothetical protein
MPHNLSSLPPAPILLSPPSTTAATAPPAPAKPVIVPLMSARLLTKLTEFYVKMKTQ